MSDDANKKIEGNAAVSGVSNALSVGYSEGLCGCFSDIKGCLLVFCLPCWPVASTKAALDERDCHVCDFFCGTGGYQLRQTIRSKYKMGYAPIMDVISLYCCGPCALHQDIRQMAKNSGKAPTWMTMPGKV